MSLQELFLQNLQHTSTQVSIFLVNGIKLIGVVEAFDQYIILLRNGQNNQAIYKHAISTIVPEEPYTFESD